MRSHSLRSLLIGTAIGVSFLTGCSTLLTTTTKKPYNVVAYKPRNPGNVRVKLSLENRAVYVLEGSRPLLVTAVTIGKAGDPTPTGSYHVDEKIKNKRSNTYGFWSNGSVIRAGTSDHSPGGGFHYVGYPMAYWVGFKPAYGFHQGAVWPIGHSHGCVRLHPNVAPKFFALVRMGTPVTIAHSLAEDQTIGKNLPRPTDYNDPDLPASYLISSKFFTPPAGPLLQEQ